MHKKGQSVSGDILKRKVRIIRRSKGEGGTAAEKAWRVAFSRAVRDESGLPIEFASVSMMRMSLTEVLELPEDRALILVLEGPEQGMGLMVLGPEVTGSIIEWVTLGRIGVLPPEVRRPTRTEAAMIAPLCELALRNLEDGLESESDLSWTSDFRFGSFLDDARPLGLLLEDLPYHVMQAKVSLGGDLRQGSVLLVLPAEGRGRKPASADDPVAPLVEVAPFADRLADQVAQAKAKVEAVLARITLPIGDAMALCPDLVIPLPDAGLDQISLEGLDARRIGMAQLGQHRGMRAVRLIETSQVERGIRVTRAEMGTGQPPAPNSVDATVPAVLATGTG